MIEFITEDVILHVQEELIRRFGGTAGIRDQNLLRSAIPQPSATFDGEYLHKDIFSMAAAYGFHLCENHPFVDGNKRIAFMATYIFLHRNGYGLELSKKRAYLTFMSLASSQMSKEGLAEILRGNCRKRDS